MFEKSEVMMEFLKIAEKSGLIKEAVEKKKDKKDTADSSKKKEDIIEQAHPEAVYVAESMGDGGLVENQNEQHKKIVDIINKMPTGALVHIYSSAALELIKTADKCDGLGLSDVADIISDAAVKIMDLAANAPLVEAPAKN